MNPQNRRHFIQTLTAGAAALGASRALAEEAKPAAALDARTHLTRLAYSKQEVDDWFAGKIFRFGEYHPEWGWLLQDGRFRDGIDGATSTYTYTSNPHRERRMIAHADRPCRINTYGNSFTQGHQVNEAETWQEVLASHLGEPVRNFGIGAWSVYQAWLRMKYEEERCPADLIILNIYDDDHYRNLDAWRSIRAEKDEKFISPTLPHLVVNLGKKTVEERPNPCPTKESFYNLCDPEWVYNRFKDDFSLQIVLAHANATQNNPDAANKAVLELAITNGIRTRNDASDHADLSAKELHNQAAFFASEWVVEQASAFAKARGKKFLVVLSCSALRLANFARKKTRSDQPFVDWLASKGIPFVDLLPAHMADFSEYNVPIERYIQRHFIGHYTPLGNHFCAFAMKNKVVELLDPKPSAYLWP